jgi:hypothetical protein
MIYGASSQKLIATAFWARRSAVSDSIRDPVKRQTTITLAGALIELPNAQPTKSDRARRETSDQADDAFGGHPDK